MTGRGRADARHHTLLHTCSSFSREFECNFVFRPSNVILWSEGSREISAHRTARGGRQPMEGSIDTRARAGSNGKLRYDGRCGSCPLSSGTELTAVTAAVMPSADGRCSAVMEKKWPLAAVSPLSWRLSS